MLSEDKISHLSHIILQAVTKSPLVTVQADEGRVLKEIKRVLASELAQEEDIDRQVNPHPSEVVRPGSHPAQLTTLRRKAELVEQLGIDVFCVLPFTPELSKVPADEFVHEVLIEKLHVAAVVVGENFAFGHRAAGNVALLSQLGHRFGFVTEGAKLVVVPNSEPGSEITFSSTYIRACIDAGDVTAAQGALGRPHRLEGIVVRGDRRGHELGFPTANLSTPRYAAVPADGVYACQFTLLNPASEGPRMAAVSVGTNPTFSGRERRVEAFVLDVDADFYGQRVAIDFVRRLRAMERFPSSDALVEQMHRDVQRTREVLGGGTQSGERSLRSEP